MSLNTFTNACFEAMAFTDFNEDNEIPENATVAEETRFDLAADCRSFYRRFGPFIDTAGGTDEQAGHDFWLTRNGHGAGFWDGDWPEPYADILTTGAKNYGEFQTYLGDDGKIYA